MDKFLLEDFGGTNQNDDDDDDEEGVDDYDDIFGEFDKLSIKNKGEVIVCVVLGSRACKIFLLTKNISKKSTFIFPATNIFLANLKEIIFND